MELFFQQVFNGIMLGSTYALVALGLTLVLGILNVSNFAHGDLYMLAAYITFTLIVNYSIGFWPAVLVSMVTLAIVGVFIEKFVFRPLRDQSPINPFIAAVGLMLFLETFVIVVWGPRGQRIPNPYPGAVDLFGISTTQQRLIVVVAAVVLIGLLQLFIKRTTMGATIEATAQDREGAALVGINVNRVSSVTFAIAGALAAAAASLIAPIFMIAPGMGALPVMKAFAIIILGGVGSIPGAIAGAYVLGMVESLGGGYLSAAYKDVYAFGALVLVLAIRPTGLFGKEEH